ncbi:hypothetical protein V8F20_002935 [Naviculisporaceae sp. PSN 640]
MFRGILNPPLSLLTQYQRPNSHSLQHSILPSTSPLTPRYPIRLASSSRKLTADTETMASSSTAGGTSAGADEFSYSSGGVYFHQQPPQLVQRGVAIHPTVRVRKPMGSGDFDSRGRPRQMNATVYLIDWHTNQAIPNGLSGQDATGRISTASSSSSGGGSSSRPQVYQDFSFPHLTVQYSGSPYTLLVQISRVDRRSNQYVTEGHAYSEAFTSQ